jgi:hypothetical protein
MVPAIGAVTANIGGNGGYIWDPGKFATHQNLQQYIQLSSGGQTEIPYRLPVSEPVLLDQKNATSPSQVQMVPQVAQTRQLGIQGLCFDFIRGSTSASSIRENPSQVFGISTPGRLSTFGNTSLSKQVLSEIQTFLNSGDSSGDSAIKDALTTTFRTGGHQFVMDDGTVEGLDQGIRIRTTAGNMIQLDDTNGQIYIINSTGNAWIELSPSGFIDIYAKNDFSIRSQGDINFHADKDILINANGSIKMHSQKALQIDSLDKTTIRSVSDTTIYSLGNNKFGAGGSFAIEAAAQSSIQSQNPINIKGSVINLNSGPSAAPITDPGPLPLSSKIDVTQQSGSKVWWQDTNSPISTIVNRAPAHEPWNGHEINGIETFSIEQGKIVGVPVIYPQSSGTLSGVRGTQMIQTASTTPEQKLTFIQAIAKEEGFYVNGSRPQRDNNPGDIVYGRFTKAHGATGGDPRFAIFPTVDLGWQALRILLNEHYAGLTVTAALNKFAPPVENATNLYINNVCKWTGLTPSTVLTAQNIG